MTGKNWLALRIEAASFFEARKKDIAESLTFCFSQKVTPNFLIQF